MTTRGAIDRDAVAAFARQQATAIAPLTGNQEIGLDDASVVWVVLEGEGLVFATDAPGTLPSRPRNLVTRLATGSVAAAVDGSSVGRRWILVSLARCVVAEVPLGAVDRRSADGAPPLVDVVGEWLDAAGADPVEGGTADDVAGRLDGSRIALAEAEVRALDEQLTAEAGLVDASARAVELESELALDHLGSVLERRATWPVGAVGHDELLAVCREVGRSLGVTVHAAHPEDLLRASPVEAIALSSKVRARPMQLPDGWWTQPGDSFVGYRANGRPVAVLARRRGYDVVDTTSGERVGVDATVARDLRNDGIELVRPLPEGPLTIRALIRFAGRGTGRDVVRLVLAALVIGLIALVPPLATSLVFGQIVPQHQNDRLAALAAALVGLAIGSFFLQLARGVALLRARTTMDHALQLGLWDRLLRLPAPFFRRYQVGDLTERSMAVDSIRESLTDSVITTLLAGIFGLFNLVVMIAIDVRLAVVGLLVTAAGAAVLFGISRAYQGPLSAVLRDRRAMTATTHELLNGIVKVRTASAERRIFARWAVRYAGDTRRSYEAFRIDDVRVVFEGAFPTAMVLILFATVVLIGREAVPTAAFMGFYVALGQLQTAVVNVARSTVTLLEVRPVLDQASPILEEAAESDTATEHPGRVDGGFALREVTFTYPGATRPIFDGLSVSIEPGEFVAVVGPSGSGKSTLLRLVLGFEEIDGGTVTIDGVDITSLDMDAVRRQIGVVLQQTALLPGSVFENIAGSVPITEDEAWERRAAPGSIATSSACPTAWRPTSATVSASSRGASASGSRSPGPSPGGPAPCCSTRRPRPSTTSPSRS